MEKRLQNFLVEQKTETIRLIKEIANLQKEKESLKNEIEDCFERLNKLEKIIGTNKDYNKTIGDAKLGNKSGIEIKKKKSFGGPGIGIEGIENNDIGGDNNVNTRMTGNTVSNPGEGLSENFNVNTIGSNNAAFFLTFLSSHIMNNKSAEALFIYRYCPKFKPSTKLSIIRTVYYRLAHKGSLVTKSYPVFVTVCNC